MRACRICDGQVVHAFLSSSSTEPLGAEDLRITDRQYGKSASLVQCDGCGFIWAEPPAAVDLVPLYADLQDPEYLAGHDYRLQQMERLLDRALKGIGAPVKTLLDVGAASGLLVEAAVRRGIDAVGVEPSRYLAEAAAERGLPVAVGVWPHPAFAGRTFDLVAAVDVIEHVDDPGQLLRDLSTAVAPGGHLLLTTPDPDSLARRLLGRRWWHFRLAHVCFLPLRTLERALAAAGLRAVHHERQVWYFSGAYLSVRLARMLGGERLASLAEPLGRSSLLGKIRIPLDLRDSWVVLAERVA